jgi:hypothetical protein
MVFRPQGHLCLKERKNDNAFGIKKRSPQLRSVLIIFSPWNPSTVSMYLDMLVHQHDTLPLRITLAKVNYG